MRYVTYIYMAELFCQMFWVFNNCFEFLTTAAVLLFAISVGLNSSDFPIIIYCTSMESMNTCFFFPHRMLLAVCSCKHLAFMCTCMPRVITDSGLKAGCLRTGFIWMDWFVLVSTENLLWNSVFVMFTH